MLNRCSREGHTRSAARVVGTGGWHAASARAPVRARNISAKLPAFLAYSGGWCICWPTFEDWQLFRPVGLILSGLIEPLQSGTSHQPALAVLTANPSGVPLFSLLLHEIVYVRDDAYAVNMMDDDG